MQRKYILGVDIGSSGIKAVIFALDGCIKGSFSSELDEFYIQDGYVEQNPDQIWEKFCITVKGAVADSGVSPEDIIGMGMDTNRSGLLLLDQDGCPLTNIATWRDTRAKEDVKRFKSANPDLDMYRITGEEGLPQHTIFKTLWYRREKSSVWRRARHILFAPGDYVLYKLTGNLITSKSVAQSSGFFDITTLAYSEPILERAEISREMLPTPHDANEIVGMVSSQLASLLGLSQGTPIACGLCDATASQVGSGSVDDCVFAVSIGTCGAVRGFCKELRYEADHTTQIRVAPPYGYVPSCTISDAGSVLKWYRDQFCKYEQQQAVATNEDVYDLISKEAETMRAGSQGLILIPIFTSASYAVKDENAFGSFIGIRNYHTHAHFARAIMEGVSMSLKTVLERFEANGFVVSEVHLGGGGAKSDVWIQILSDVLNKRISIPECMESSCLGAAVITAVAVGVYGDMREAVKSMVRIQKEYRPDQRNVEIYENTYHAFQCFNQTMSDTGYYQLHNELTNCARIGSQPEEF